MLTASPAAVDASMAAEKALTDSTMLQIHETLVAMDEYVAFVAEQHSRLLGKLSILTSNSLDDSTDCMERLGEQAEKLEVVFESIDALERLLGDLNTKILIVHNAVKNIAQPTNMKERAASFLKSFGLKSSAVEERASGGIWNRIPPHVLLDGLDPQEYSATLSDLFDVFRQEPLSLTQGTPSPSPDPS